MVTGVTLPAVGSHDYFYAGRRWRTVPLSQLPRPPAVLQRSVGFSSAVVPGAE